MQLNWLLFRRGWGWGCLEADGVASGSIINGGVTDGAGFIESSISANWVWPVVKTYSFPGPGSREGT